MQIILLTHSRETSKKTNTGQLVEQIIPSTLKIIWQRAQPDQRLLNLIESTKIALLYPITSPDISLETAVSDENQNRVSVADFEHFILIDSTWQEARKIFNRSAYLQSLPRVQLSVETTSKYSLRRNQVEGGLCTAECAIELLRQTEQIELAEELNLHFTKFINSAR